ncbi:hypothetical protein [Streptomyces parvus]|uniref:hypothetical protein n=1 Tax=Streptomyces parvus TaxID=66428 RepID=UPI003D72FB5D
MIGELVFVAEFPGVGDAAFSDLEPAQEWCDRHALKRYPGEPPEWSEPAPGSAQIWIQEHADGRADLRLASIKLLQVDQEVAPS